jgi:hypothetical protein
MEILIVTQLMCDFWRYSGNVCQAFFCFFSFPHAYRKDTINRIIVDFELLQNIKDIHLTIMSIVPEEEAATAKLLA